MTDPNNLLIIRAFDPPENAPWRQMAKLLSSSLLRTYFTGKIVVLRNTEAPLYLIEREELHEIYVSQDNLPLNASGPRERDGRQKSLSTWSRKWLWQLPLWVDASRFDRVFLMDADCLALRNLDHLLEGDAWDIRYQSITGYPLNKKDLAWPPDTDLPARETAHEGIWAVRGALLAPTLARWRKIAESPLCRSLAHPERAAWNRLLMESAGRVERFEAHEIQFAPSLQKDWSLYRGAALVHASGLEPRLKVEFLYGLWQQRFFCDAPLTLLHLLET